MFNSSYMITPNSAKPLRAIVQTEKERTMKDTDELKELFEQLLENYYYAEGFCMQEGMSEYKDRFKNIINNINNLLNK